MWISSSDFLSRTLGRVRPWPTLERVGPQDSGLEIEDSGLGMQALDFAPMTYSQNYSLGVAEFFIPRDFSSENVSQVCLRISFSYSWNFSAQNENKCIQAKYNS